MQTHLPNIQKWKKLEIHRKEEDFPPITPFLPPSPPVPSYAPERMTATWQDQIEVEDDDPACTIL